jgi:hypothetical protein
MPCQRGTKFAHGPQLMPFDTVLFLRVLVVLGQVHRQFFFLRRIRLPRLQRLVCCNHRKECWPVLRRRVRDFLSSHMLLWLDKSRARSLQPVPPDRLCRLRDIVTITIRVKPVSKTQAETQGFPGPAAPLLPFIVAALMVCPKFIHKSLHFVASLCNLAPKRRNAFAVDLARVNQVLLDTDSEASRAGLHNCTLCDVD